MTFGAYMGIALALGLVLLLLGASLKLLQRLAPGAARGRGRLPMELVQRMAIGPKQGVAVIRIGERVLAVSVGDGGMRRLFELDEDEAAAIIASSAPVATAPRAVSAGGVDFRAAFSSALRTAGLGGALVLLTLGALPGTTGAQAAPARTAPTAPAAGSAAAAAAALVAGRAAATSGTPASAAAATTTPAAGGPSAASIATVAVSRLAPSMDLRVGNDAEKGGLRLSGTVGIVVMMGLMTLLPTLLLMMTSFTRILIVLHFLRQALGTQNAPPAQLVAAIALLLSGFVMAPTLTAVNRDALQPWMAGTIDQGQMLERGAVPFRQFMLRQTRDHDLQVFVGLSRGPRPATAAEVPLVTLMSAFVTSELRTAFQIGFALFLPFIIIDVVVSSVLMSMGMMMLPPAMISLPFKLLLFVLVDGWTLIVQSLVASFR